jgi:hypothetical protein
MGRQAVGGTGVARRSNLEEAVLRELSEPAATRASIPRILGMLGERFGLNVGVLWTPDEAGTYLGCAAVWHDSGGEFAGVAAALRDRLLAVGEGPAGRAWILQEPQWRSLDAASVDRSGLRMSAAFPLVVDGGCEGVVEVFVRSPGRPDVGLRAVLAATGPEFASFLRHRC